MPMSFEPNLLSEIIFEKDFEEEDYKLRHRQPSQPMDKTERKYLATDEEGQESIAMLRYVSIRGNAPDPAQT